MRSTLRIAAVVLAVVVFTASVSRANAQVVVYRSAPVVSYYAPPVVSYYAPPVVSYYSPPVVSYYAPAVSYYTPAYVPTTVTTYQGILPWRRYTVATYGAAPVVAPSVRYYYAPGYVIR